MVYLDSRSLSVCIQALQTAIKHHDFLSQSQTVDKDDFEECFYMYELELCRLVDLYKKEEQLGNACIPLNDLLKPPFDN